MAGRCWGMSKMRALLVLVSVLAAMLSVPANVLAQANPNQFGAQDRADSASRMIVLGVQQGISSLPPTSGQSFTYEFDPQLATYKASERLGPTSFRSPQTIGAGKFSLRFATSYFELADTKTPIPYQINNPPDTAIGVAALGLQANAKVGLINLAASYGFSNQFEMTMNLPVVVVDAHASQIFSTRSNALTLPASQAPLSGPAVSNGNVPGALTALQQSLQPGGPLALRHETFNALGFNFNEGTQAGVGRISTGVKGVLYADKVVQLAVAPEFFLPSPSEDEFAGSGSAAILPRVLAAFTLADPLKLHVDAGYDYDFDSDELRRFVWNFGGSVALPWATFDAGVGGSKFNQGIQWTPPTAKFNDAAGNPGMIQALGSTRLGDNFVDALGGVKVRLTDRSVVSGAVNVPLNNEGFRAAAVGTLAVELYF